MHPLEQPSESPADEHRAPPADAPRAVYGAARGHGRARAEAALRFWKKAIRRHGIPETITIDGSEANVAAIRSYNQEHGTAIAICQVKDLNNIIEQDHRGVKRMTRPMLGFKSFEAAHNSRSKI